MPTPIESTAQTIVQAALECLEQHGLQGLTVRKIATHAGVNLAAINYHFGSKEKLLEQVFELATASAFQDLDQLVNAQSGAALEQQLREFLFHYTNGLMRYPNVSKVLIHELVSAGNGQVIISQRLETFLKSLAERFARLHQRNPHDLEIRFQTMQIISVFICAALIPEVFRHALKLDLRQAKTRSQMIEAMLKPPQ
jgi:TetR/AcrR family transcriptional regulator, regulator of cefoperazone and chloramphenicol sensitivity